MRSLARNSMLVVLTAACSYQAPDDVLPLQLVAVQPSIANAGDTIMLEGTFADTVLHTVVVNFPGGVTQRAEVLGLHRARVVVPASAADMAGDLYVSRGTEEVGPVAFRRVSFGLELQAFGELPVHLGDANTFVTSAVVNNFLYVLGGEKQDSNGNGYGWTSSVERATIDPRGSLGPFGDAGVALITARSGHATAIIGEWLYVLGGLNGGGLGSVERAPIFHDGSLGRFADVPGVTLKVPRWRHSTAVLGNSLYVLGGTATSVERATINPDGSLEPFSIVSGVSVPSSSVPPANRRLGPVTVVVGDGLYVVGGFDDHSLASVDRAPISPDGSLGPFVSTGSTLTTSRADAGHVVLGNLLYMLGGISLGVAPPFNWLSVTERVPLGSESLGTFTNLPVARLLTARRGAATAVAGDYVYVLGGDQGHIALNTIERAAIRAGL